MTDTVKEKLWKAFDALEGMSDSEADCFETEEEEAEYFPAQYAARIIFSVLEDLGMAKK